MRTTDHTILSALLFTLAPAACVHHEPDARRADADAAAWANVQWVHVETPTRESLRGLAIAADDVIWVGGANGTLLRTIDGGASWQDVAPPDCRACDFRDIEAFAADEALVMVAGQPARVYRTANGGSTWTIVHEDPRPEAFFDAMSFDADSGVLLGDPIDGTFVVLTSEDRGQTWERVPADILPPAAPGEAAFAASGTCVQRGVGRLMGGIRASFCTGGGKVRLLGIPYVEGGASAVDLPLRSGSPARGAFSLAMYAASAPTRGVIVGGDYEQPLDSDGTAAWSDDGGATWRASEGGAGGYRSCAVWLDSTSLLAVGSHGASVSFDCGRTWWPFGSSGFHTVAVARTGAVWACGSDGRVARLRRDAVSPVAAAR